MNRYKRAGTRLEKLHAAIKPHVDHIWDINYGDFSRPPHFEFIIDNRDIEAVLDRMDFSMENEDLYENEVYFDVPDLRLGIAGEQTGDEGNFWNFYINGIYEPNVTAWYHVMEKYLNANQIIGDSIILQSLFSSEEVSGILTDLGDIKIELMDYGENYKVFTIPSLEIEFLMTSESRTSDYKHEFKLI